MKLPSIKLNYIYSTINTLLLMSFPLVIFPYATRILHPQGIGINSFAQSIVTYFVLFAQLGVPLYGIREVAKAKDSKEALSKVVCELLCINFFVTFLSFILLLTSTLLITQLYEIKSLIAVYSVLLFLTPLGAEWCYNGLEKYGYITVRNFVFKLISLLILFLTVKTEQDVIAYAWVIVIANVGSYICNIVNLHKYITITWRGLEFKKHLKPIFTLFLMSASISVYASLPVSILGFFSTPQAVGIFSAALKICLALLALTVGAGKVIMPRLSYYLANNLTDDFKRLLSRSFGFTCFSTGFMVFFILLNADYLIQILCGPEFAAAALPLQLMSLVIFFAGISNVTGLQILIPLGYEKVVALSVAAGAGISIILYCLFIPWFDYNACAAAMSITELAVLGIQQLYLKRHLSVQIDYKATKTYLLSAFFAMLIPFYIKHLTLPFWIKFILSSAVFSLGYLTLLMIFKEPFVWEGISLVKKKYSLISQKFLQK